MQWKIWKVTDPQKQTMKSGVNVFAHENTTVTSFNTFMTFYS